MISSIGWASDLITIAGGDGVLAGLAARQGAKQRIIADVLHVKPLSWCPALVGVRAVAPIADTTRKSVLARMVQCNPSV